MWLVSPFSFEKMSKMCCPPCPIQMTTFSSDGSEVREAGLGHRCVLDSRRMSSGIPGRRRRLATPLPQAPTSPQDTDMGAQTGEGTCWVSCKQEADVNLWGWAVSILSFYSVSLLCRRKVKAQKGPGMWKVGGRAEIRTSGPDPVSLTERGCAWGLRRARPPPPQSRVLSSSCSRVPAWL